MGFDTYAFIILEVVNQIAFNDLSFISFLFE
jgi:hypothetical protein